MVVLTAHVLAAAHAASRGPAYRRALVASHSRADSLPRELLTRLSRPATSTNSPPPSLPPPPAGGCRVTSAGSQVPNRFPGSPTLDGRHLLTETSERRCSDLIRARRASTAAACAARTANRRGCGAARRRQDARVRPDGRSGPRPRRRAPLAPMSSGGVAAPRRGSGFRRGLPGPGPDGCGVESEHPLGDGASTTALRARVGGSAIARWRSRVLGDDGAGPEHHAAVVTFGGCVQHADSFPGLVAKDPTSASLWQTAFMAFRDRCGDTSFHSRRELCSPSAPVVVIGVAPSRI